MSNLYNLLFGRNAHTELLLAVLGLREPDVERLRDVQASDDGTTITIYTRTGGGNREGYPNLTMRRLPTWQGSVDDDFDSTYCTDVFAVPERFVKDVAQLRDPLKHGIRASFARHIGKTLNRKLTEGDMLAVAREREHSALKRVRHDMANGHTFVPYDDTAMQAALELAEKNGGRLLTAWAILPLELHVRTNFFPYPDAREEKFRKTFVRHEVRVDYAWRIDLPYWRHCVERFSSEFPVTMAVIAERVEATLASAEVTQ